MKKRWSRLLTIGAGVLLGLGSAQAVKAADEAPAKPGYTLDFDDEFNGPTLDKSKWTDYYLPHWTADPETAKANYRFENGKLIEYIAKDQKPWSPTLDGTVKSSAIMSFNKNWIHNFSGNNQILSNQKEWQGYVTKYGYFEIRAKLSDVGGGGHQAWWMVGMQDDTNDWFNSKQTAEIDVLETFFRRQNTWRIAAFGWNDPFFENQWELFEDPVPEGNPTKEYHTYGLDWEPGSLKFYYDGKLYKQINQAPDYPMGTILNIYTDAGSGKGNDIFPKSWSIDYFRVYKKNGGYDLPKTTLQNSASKKYVTLDPNSAAVQVTSEPTEYSTWQLVPKGRYFLIQNVATKELLHIEDMKDYVEHGKVPATHWSAQWQKITKDNQIYFVNRWQPNKTIAIDSTSSNLQNKDFTSPTADNLWNNQFKTKENLAKVIKIIVKVKRKIII